MTLFLRRLNSCSTAAYEDSEKYEAWLDYLSKGGTTEERERRMNEIKKAAVRLVMSERKRQGQN